MPDKHAIYTRIEEDGFHIQYNGVGISAIKRENDECYDVSLSKLEYDLCDRVISEKPASEFGKVNLKSNRQRKKIAWQARKITRASRDSSLFTIDDEKEVRRLLEKYACPDQNQSSIACYSNNPHEQFLRQQRKEFCEYWRRTLWATTRPVSDESPLNGRSVGQYLFASGKKDRILQ